MARAGGRDDIVAVEGGSLYGIEADACYSRVKIMLVSMASITSGK